MLIHKIFPRCAATLLALAIISFSGQAKASDVIGSSCSDNTLGETKGLGRTKMADDGKNIIACLKDDSGNLLWKSMTSSGGGGMCGFLVLSGQADRAVGYSTAQSGPPDVTGTLNRTVWMDGQQTGASSPVSVIFNSYCNGSSLISGTGVGCQWDCAIQASGYKLSCPSGYTLQLVSSGANAISGSNSADSDDCRSTWYYYAGAFFCGKLEVPTSILDSRGGNTGGYYSTWTCIKK